METAKVAAITKAKQIVFHTVGDTGPTGGPKTIQEVADKMCGDMQEANAADVPSFFFHLGDVVYDFGEDSYYYDQFFDPFRDYDAPIVAIPGNHDGEIYPPTIRQLASVSEGLLRQLVSTSARSGRPEPDVNDSAGCVFRLQCAVRPHHRTL